MFTIPENLNYLYKKQIAEYLKSRMEADSCFAELCNTSTKTMDGVVRYVKHEAQKQTEDCGAFVPDSEVYQWASHYIEESSLDFEPKPEEEKKKSDTKINIDAIMANAKAAQASKTLKEEVDQLSFDFS